MRGGTGHQRPTDFPLKAAIGGKVAVRRRKRNLAGSLRKDRLHAGIGRNVGGQTDFLRLHGQAPFPRERLAGLRQRQKIDDHDAASVPIRPGPEEAGGLRVDFRREGGTGACAEQDMKTLLKSLPDGVLALESPGTDTDADRGVGGGVSGGPPQAASA